MDEEPPRQWIGAKESVSHTLTFEQCSGRRDVSMNTPRVCVCESIILPSAGGQRSPLSTTGLFGYLAHS